MKQIAILSMLAMLAGCATKTGPGQADLQTALSVASAAEAAYAATPGADPATVRKASALVAAAQAALITWDASGAAPDASAAEAAIAALTVYEMMAGITAGH